MEELEKLLAGLDESGFPMLYDTNMQNMVGAITPSNDKLVSKGIQSVRQHITLLKDYISLNIEAVSYTHLQHY